jgi:hypothetical protein
VLVKIETTLPPLRFDRQHSSAHLTDAFLDEVTGSYALGPVTTAVTRRGDKGLLVSVNGGAPVELVPRTGRGFTLDGSPVELTEDGRLATPMADFLRV